MTLKKIEGEKDRKKVRMKRGIAVRQKCTVSKKCEIETLNKIVNAVEWSDSLRLYRTLFWNYTGSPRMFP